MPEQADAWGKAVISMRVIRADGTVEDRGVVSETEVERDPMREKGDA